MDLRTYLDSTLEVETVFSQSYRGREKYSIGYVEFGLLI
jgi:hypothetical protein